MAASMIAAVCWVPRGAANPIPLKAEPPADDEIEALKIAHDLEVHRRWVSLVVARSAGMEILRKRNCQILWLWFRELFSFF